MLSQRQDFLNNHPAGVLITPNQQETKFMRDEALLNVGAQGLDMSGCQVSDLNDVDF